MVLFHFPTFFLAQTNDPKISKSSLNTFLVKQVFKRHNIYVPKNDLDSPQSRSTEDMQVPESLITNQVICKMIFSADFFGWP